MTFLDRFYAKVKVQENGCHLFMGAKSSKGYGSLNYKKGFKTVTISAHVLAFIIYNKRLPIFDIHHKCENKACVNPEHLVELDKISHKKEHHKICRSGHHILTNDNQYKNGKCKICQRESVRKYQKKRRLYDLR